MSQENLLDRYHRGPVKFAGTGWIGVIARLMHVFGTTTAEQMLELGKVAAFVETESPKTRTSKAPQWTIPGKSPTE